MSEQAHVVCPECWAVNRVPRVRFSNLPRCGRCKAGLFKGQSVDLSVFNFDRFLRRNDIPVLVDFWAPWCGPCHTMASAFEKAANQLEPYVRLARVNIDAEPSLARRYRIQNVPTLCQFHNGQEVSRRNGSMNVSDLTEWAAVIRNAS